MILWLQPCGLRNLPADVCAYVKAAGLDSFRRQHRLFAHMPVICGFLGACVFSQIAASIACHVFLGGAAESPADLNGKAVLVLGIGFAGGVITGTLFGAWLGQVCVIWRSRSCFSMILRKLVGNVYQSRQTM